LISFDYLSNVFSIYRQQSDGEDDDDDDGDDDGDDVLM